MLCNKVAENFTCNGSYITRNNGWSFYFYGGWKEAEEEPNWKEKSKSLPRIPSKMAEIIINVTCTGEVPFRVLNGKQTICFRLGVLLDHLLHNVKDKVVPM